MDKEKVSKLEEEQLNDVQGGSLINPTYPVPSDIAKGVVLNYKEALEK